MKSRRLLDNLGGPDHGEIGVVVHELAAELWPLPRSITGGVRQTLEILKREVPGLIIGSIPSGTQCFDWTVPDEWSITDAFIEDESGVRIVDFRQNNLHVVGYSVPVDEWIELEQLQQHLHSLPEQTNAIPYVTSYYSPRWGFCMTETQRRTLRPRRYHVVIRSELKAGVLNYGELLVHGESDQEILLSTYICHPSMANNELSGPGCHCGAGHMAEQFGASEIHLSNSLYSGNHWLDCLLKLEPAANAGQNGCRICRHLYRR